MRAVVLMLMCVGLILSGCGGDSEKASSPQTVTVVERTVTAEPDEATTPPAEEQSAPSGGSSSSGKIRLPNVVGKDHQLAQDTMQAKGLYNLSEEDATGQGRVLLLDRNWTVVSQSPKAGTLVSEDRTITLSSKKDDE
jgi:ABC-type Fe3+-hydroxamate transport system substrate-binding protein